MRYVATAYLLLCLLALGVLVAGLPAFAGSDADPLAGVFAFLLALPWVLVLDLVDEAPLAVTVLATIAGMAINYAILRWLGSRFGARNTKGVES